jgi:SAM-dependent methyltransferase
MNWYATLDRLQAMLALVDDAEVFSAWKAFSADVKRAEHHPYHIERIRLELEAMTLSRGGGAVRVLDHGCGPGSTLIYLAALGYTDSFGVDVSGNSNSAQNRLARLCWGRRYDCFLEYDGHTLPFADQSFDLVISQQVVEHVPDAEYEAYFAEEGRVLASGGVALHQIPHKLVPYDSHTGTWVLSMLPDRVAQTAMKALGGGMAGPCPFALAVGSCRHDPKTHRAVSKPVGGAAHGVAGHCLLRWPQGVARPDRKGLRAAGRWAGLCPGAIEFRFDGNARPEAMT